MLEQVHKTEGIHGGWRAGRRLPMGTMSFWGGEHVGLGSRDSYTTCEYAKNTFKWLILWYVNYICIFKKREEKTSYNLIVRRQTTQLKTGERSEWTFF